MRWYLTGFLAPIGSAPDQRRDETADDESFALAGGGEGGDDDAAPELPAARRAFFPASMGVSLIVPAGATELVATVRWGDYTAEVPEAEVVDEPPPPDAPISLPDRSIGPHAWRWHRAGRECSLTLPLPPGPRRPREFALPGSDGLAVALSIRPVDAPELAPPGSRSVAVFVVNRRDPEASERRDQRFAFQVELEVACDAGLVPRPNIRGLRESDDLDERIAELQYRDAFEFAIGHGVATRAEVDPDGTCRRVTT